MSRISLISIVVFTLVMFGPVCTTVPSDSQDQNTSEPSQEQEEQPPVNVVPDTGATDGNENGEDKNQEDKDKDIISEPEYRCTLTLVVTVEPVEHDLLISPEMGGDVYWAVFVDKQVRITATTTGTHPQYTTFEWHADDGLITRTDDPSVIIWQAPQNPGYSHVTVTITYHNTTVERTIIFRQSSCNMCF